MIRGMDEDPLHGNAALARLIVGAEYGPFNHSLPVMNPFIDDESGVSSELEHDLLLSGSCLHSPSHVRRSGEAQQLHIIMRHEDLSDFPSAGHDRECSLRPAALLDDLREFQHRKRGCRGRLDDDRASCGDSGSYLVGGEIHGEIERGDPRYQADREFPDDSESSLRCLRDAEIHGFSGDSLSFSDSDGED